MNGWQKGSESIERMLAAGELQSIDGSAADGQPWLDKAKRTLRTAGVVANDDRARSIRRCVPAVPYAPHPQK